jgi:pyrroline-5-carboxylate reductase
VPLLALYEQSGHLPTPILLELEVFGRTEIVTDEGIFDRISILASPWATVIARLVRMAAGANPDPALPADAVALGIRLFSESVQALLRRFEANPGAWEAIATPGGITEAGLERLHAFSQPLDDVLKAMLDHAERMRDELKV